ncbi:hypothetical protein EDD37DRAFT_371300 [Exophiala viscosa]|uniref:uncharacterized protein n=1 Tax=Exophiala viscosa TaxID=2486360 RepID=UPI002190C46D|nr:hypothetical protein EDD37DRAFT_371300 [Exophiala viscosa]
MTPPDAGSLARVLELLERQDAVRQIHNVIGKMALLYEAAMYDERLEFIASKTPGVTIEVGGRGVFEGMDGARRCFVDVERTFEKSHAAGMRKTFPDVSFGTEHAGLFESELPCVPVIEVAGDGKTAKAIWTSLQACGKTHEWDPKPQASWIWWRNAVDFVKEDGKWKIWHMLRNPFFFAPYTKDWVDASLTLPPIPPPGTQKGIPGHEGAPDRPTTKMYDSYRITREPRYWPKAPEPYESFDEKEAYIGDI